MLNKSLIRKVIGPSPAFFVLTKIGATVFVRGGSEPRLDLDQDFADFEFTLNQPKPPRISQEELNYICNHKANGKLTRNERLLKSVIEHTQKEKVLAKEDFENLGDYLECMSNYRFYRRLKRFIPLCLVSSFTTTELSKIAYTAALGSKSVMITIPGIIGYSLPAFFFWHMSYYYAPERLKPACQVCKYALGAPFIVVNCLIDELTAPVEEKLFGATLPIDVTGTGGTLPSEIGDLPNLMEDIKSFQKEFSQPGY